jgi:hypothetical protein
MDRDPTVFAVGIAGGLDVNGQADAELARVARGAPCGLAGAELVVACGG